ncbi:hypothetical protein PV328_002796 [Microctonus aethiopoides]|uniref:Uncharacterized protein n=1 Tax=Microctonus aethiopoides TaxID=144406 RepID=A0AA39F731_9HYME|nr:hypothetical protein PV328_002796 [Microctonus aethiopoides]
MGVGGSVNNNSRYNEPPPLPPPFYTGTHFPNRNSGASEETLETHNQRIRSSLTREEWWQHRPSAPSLSSLHQPANDTLLTYAAQMTGWQSECTPHAQSVHQEAMELTKTVSHLAAANQQLATAHTTLLLQLERLYVELNEEKETKQMDDKAKNCKQIDDDLKRRIETIENMLGIKSTLTMNACDCEDNVIKEFDRIHIKSKANQVVYNEDEENLKREYAKAVERIQMLESELKITHNESDIDQCVKDKYQWTIKNEEVNPENEKNVKALLSEISRLQADQLENQETNRILTAEVEKLNKLVEKFRIDYETSKSHCEKIELHLNERKQQLECLMRDFDIAKIETTQLIKQLDVFNREKDITTMRIVNLEMDLKRANCTKEETVALASEESWKLRTRLYEEIRNNKKQSEALDESLQEIQRLNEIIDTLKKVEQSDDRAFDTEIPMETDSSVERPSLEEFKKDLSMKREARQRAIAAVSSEMDRLRRELDAEKEAHSETSKILDLLKIQAENASTKGETSSVGTTTTMIEENWRGQSDWNEQNSLQFDAQRLTDVLKVSDELRACIRLQIEKIDDLRYHLECDEENNVNRITMLKNIGDTHRETFAIREAQINKLKNVLSQIIARLGDEKFHVDVNDDLRTEHDRQVEDIRRLKNLYDERIRVVVDLRDSGAKEISNVKDKLKLLSKEKEALDEDMKKSEEKIDAQDTEISNLESQLGLTKADCRDLQNQMSVINSLFSQMLLSASSADMDLDRLTQLLQENHDLISEMAREEGTEAAALPKLLLDLVEQVEGGREKIKSIDGDCDKKDDDQQEETIAHNLPKVWRVLLELLSCHAVGSTTTPTVSASLSTDPNVCYKSVDTPTGPRLVISVSKTYIRLKELILEKKHLEKEMGRMKQLNTHLESKLGEQEKRLSTVSAELSKTWNIVGRMQAQHQQLHTHEKILRYELQQKRKMLQELKQELEYCREKWESARQKNTNTEMEWRNLRREFAARKALTAHDSFNTSAESGFSDERGDDTDEECNPPDDRLRVGTRRRTRKENPRAPSPDTESEQPTDNELSESKSGSTTTPEQRTPTPEAKEMIGDSTSTVEISSGNEQTKDKDSNPLEQALANVLENLINIDEKVSSPDQSQVKIVSKTSTSSVISQENNNDTNNGEEIYVNHKIQEATEKLNNIEEINSELNDKNDFIKTADKSLEVANSISIFSIGPFPINSDVPSTKNVQFSDPLIVGPSIQSETPIFGTNEIVEVNVSKDNLTEPLESDAKNTKQEITREAIELPSTSTSSSRSGRTPEEVLAARSARLKRLEEQADWLMKKMNATNRRGSELSTRLEELHEVYGEAPVPPPMPDVLPTHRLPTDENTQATGSTITDVTDVSQIPPENSS